MNAQMQWWLRALVIVTLAFVACGDPQRSEPAVGTNSNWLRACVKSSECDDAAMCQCGACTSQCNDDMDCSALGSAHCAHAGDPAVDAVCTADALGSAAGICLPSCEPGGCKEGQACVAGSCVLAAVPDVAFCAPVANPATTERTQEDELLALLQQMRTQGGGSCGGMPLPALRFDPRLLCDARVLASDMAKTRSLSLTDSQGHTTQQRMSSAGYNATQWGEAFALQASTAARALQLMLMDQANCTQLTSARIKDFGVGVSGDVYVATFGSE